jgi:hypothetical protein
VAVARLSGRPDLRRPTCCLRTAVVRDNPRYGAGAWHLGHTTAKEWSHRRASRLVPSPCFAEISRYPTIHSSVRSTSLVDSASTLPPAQGGFRGKHRSMLEFGARIRRKHPERGEGSMEPRISKAGAFGPARRISCYQCVNRSYSSVFWCCGPLLFVSDERFLMFDGESAITSAMAELGFIFVTQPLQG